MPAHIRSLESLEIKRDNYRVLLTPVVGQFPRLRHELRTSGHVMVKGMAVVILEE